jgi:bacteriocin-like protein
MTIATGRGITIKESAMDTNANKSGMNFEAPATELSEAELENVSGGGVVSAVAGAVKEVGKEVVRILSTGSIGGVGDGRQAGGGNCSAMHA